MNFKVLTDDNKNILFHYNLCSAQEPMESYICLDPLLEGTYPFVHLGTYRGNQIVSHLDDSSRKDE